VLASVIVLLGMELENIYGCHCGGWGGWNLRFPSVIVPLLSLGLHLATLKTEVPANEYKWKSAEIQYGGDN
jgi:hypothetical protein